MRARDMVQQVLLRVQQQPQSKSSSKNLQQRKQLKHRQLQRCDDTSLGSTSTVDRIDDHKPPIDQSSSSTSCSSSRSVCFDDGAVQMIEAQFQLTENLCKELWYTQEEYKRFKESNIDLVKSLNLMEQARSKQSGDDPVCQATLLNLYRSCCSTAIEPQEMDNSYCSSSDSSSSDSSSSDSSSPSIESSSPIHTPPSSVCGGSSILTNAEERNLKQLYDDEQFGDLLVGLERQICRSIHKDKYQRRIRLVYLVYDIQQARSECHAFSFNDDLTDELRRECQNISRASRHFAHHVALAHMKLSNSVSGNILQL